MLLFFAGRPVGNPSISTSVFDCGANFEIALNLICDGVDNCVAGGGATRSGSDEITGICDSKSYLRKTNLRMYPQAGSHSKCIQ